jgi:hypothetical protein
MFYRMNGFNSLQKIAIIKLFRRAAMTMLRKLNHCYVVLVARLWRIAFIHTHVYVVCQCRAMSAARL